MSIAVLEQLLEIDGVQSIVLSTIQPDLSSSAYIRLIQIYTDPPSNTNRRPVLTLQLHGGNQNTNDQSGLAVAIPPITSD